MVDDDGLKQVDPSETYRVERRLPSGTWGNDYLDTTDVVQAVKNYNQCADRYRNADVRLIRNDTILAFREEWAWNGGKPGGT